MDELFEMEKKEGHRFKSLGHLYRKLFLLVFAIALLAQGLLWVEKGLSDYHQTLQDTFKVLLTLDVPADSAQVEQWGQQLNQQPYITSVRLFSPEDALAIVRHQNPQLVDSLLLMGKNKMPAYFELQFTPAAVQHIRPVVEQLTREYESFNPHYNEQQAKMVYYTGIYSKLLRALGLLALLAFLAFMFLVEAACGTQTHAWGGIASGVLAACVSWGVLAAVLYPVGMLPVVWTQFTTWPRQALLVAFCGLLGWTLSKWQKF